MWDIIKLVYLTGATRPSSSGSEILPTTPRAQRAKLRRISVPSTWFIPTSIAIIASMISFSIPFSLAITLYVPISPFATHDVMTRTTIRAWWTRHGRTCIGTVTFVTMSTLSLSEKRNSALMLLFESDIKLSFGWDSRRNTKMIYFLRSFRDISRISSSRSCLCCSIFSILSCSAFLSALSKNTFIKFI